MVSVFDFILELVKRVVGSRFQHQTTGTGDSTADIRIIAVCTPPVLVPTHLLKRRPSRRSEQNNKGTSREKNAIQNSDCRVKQTFS